jgi:hypothetical protein
MHNYRETISKKATRSKSESRLHWQEFAREQAQWWDKLAHKLEEDS